MEKRGVPVCDHTAEAIRTMVGIDLQYNKRVLPRTVYKCRTLAEQDMRVHRNFDPEYNEYPRTLQTSPLPWGVK